MKSKPQLLEHTEYPDGKVIVVVLLDRRDFETYPQYYGGTPKGKGGNLQIGPEA